MKIFYLFITTFISLNIQAQTATAINSGNWNDANTWQNQFIPQSGWDVVVDNGVNLTLTAGTHADINLLTHNGSNIFLDSLATLNVNKIAHNGDTIFIHPNGGIYQDCDTSFVNSGTGVYAFQKSFSSTNNHYAFSSPFPGMSILNPNPLASACDQQTWEISAGAWKYDYPVGFTTTCNGNNITFTSNYVIAGGDGIFDLGRGYVVSSAIPTVVTYAQNNVNNQTYQKSISTTTVMDRDWNLLGNPYPGSIDGKAFIQENLNVFQGSIVHVNEYGNADAVSTLLCETPLYENTVIANSEIKMGESFWIYTHDSLLMSGQASVTFNNCMRKNFHTVTPTYDSTRITWLKMKDVNTPTSATIAIGYKTGITTNNYDHGYESDYINYIDFSWYFSANNHNLLINAIAPPNVFTGHISDLKTYVAVLATINFSIDSTNTSDSIFIIDGINNDTTLINNNPNLTYTISPSDSLRFKLLIKPELVTIPGSVDEYNPTNLKYWLNQNELNIESLSSHFDEVTIYDLTGKAILTNHYNNTQLAKINISQLTKGAFIAKVNHGGKSQTFKFIIP